MQALIDSVGGYDCEVVGDTFYIFSSGALGIAAQTTWEDLLKIAAKLQPELVEQTDYYADDRVGNRALNVVADPGMRLKTKVSPIAIIVTIIIIICHITAVYTNGHAIYAAYELVRFPHESRS
jgi:hypothetical protein